MTGKKHSPPHTDHDPCWLCGKWTEYLNRYYELAPNKGIEFINKMLVQGETLGQESVRIRGCRSAEISPRPLHPEEVVTLKMICEDFTNKWNQLNAGEKALSSQIAAQGQDINEHISEEGHRTREKLEELDVKFDKVLQALNPNGVLADSCESNCEEDGILLTHSTMETVPEGGDDTQSTVPCAKRFKVSDESEQYIPASMEQQSAASSHPSGLAGLLDFNSKDIVHGCETSDEEEQQDDALLDKIRIHKEQIRKREERSLRLKTELSKQKAPSGPWAVRLPPKTEADKLLEKKEDMKRDYHRRQMQMFRLAEKVKQLDVFSEKYKEFEKQEDLLEWLQDVLEQKEAGFEIEDDDTRETAWQQEKEDRM